VRGLRLICGGLVLCAPLLAACGGGNPQAQAANQAAFCQARSILVAARDDGQRALSAAELGDTPSATDKAGAAGARASQAKSLLAGLPKDLQSSDGGKALTDAVQHVGQATKALIGGPDSNNYDLAGARKELSAAATSIAKVDSKGC
jgi:predicted small secreted protein